MTDSRLPPLEQRNPWTICQTNPIYENPWIKIEHHDVIDPNGKPGIYGTIHYKHTAIGVIPINDQLETWLVGQYRFPLKFYSWEIPEGGAHPGEAPEVAALRELREETGLVATSVQPILTMYLSNSTSDEKALAFIARGLTVGPSDPDSTEELRVRKLPFKEVYQMVLRGEITDALSIGAILKAATHLNIG